MATENCEFFTVAAAPDYTVLHCSSVEDAAELLGRSVGSVRRDLKKLGVLRVRTTRRDPGIRGFAEWSLDKNNRFPVRLSICEMRTETAASVN